MGSELVLKRHKMHSGVTCPSAVQKDELRDPQLVLLLPEVKMKKGLWEMPSQRELVSSFLCSLNGLVPACILGSFSASSLPRLVHSL